MSDMSADVTPDSSPDALLSQSSGVSPTITPPSIKKPFIPQAYKILPHSTKPLEHQIAGHMFGKKDKYGLLQMNEKGVVLKPVQSFPRGFREHQFYYNLFMKKQSNSLKEQLKYFVPRYMGSFYAQENNCLYMALENISLCFKKPCVADIKIGPRTWDLEASPAKIARQRGKYPTHITGLRPEGIRVPDESFPSGYFELKKEYCKDLSPDDMVEECLQRFFLRYSPITSTYSVDRIAIKQLLNHCHLLSDWFEKQSFWYFFSASLLICVETDTETMRKRSCSVRSSSSNTSSDVCYGGDCDERVMSHPFPVCKANCLEVTGAPCKVIIKMIDFAHVFPIVSQRDPSSPATSPHDLNFLNGLSMLVKYLQYVLDVNDPDDVTRQSYHPVLPHNDPTCQKHLNEIVNICYTRRLINLDD